MAKSAPVSPRHSDDAEEDDDEELPDGPADDSVSKSDGDLSRPL